MGAFPKLFLLALVLTIATTTASASFDYWKLALQWPPVLGLGNPGAYVPNPPKFTIHGLWHDNFTSTFTRCPVPQEPFNVNLFSSAGITRGFGLISGKNTEDVQSCSMINSGTLNWLQICTTNILTSWGANSSFSPEKLPELDSFGNNQQLHYSEHHKGAGIDMPLVSGPGEWWMEGNTQRSSPLFGQTICVDDCPPRNSYNDCIGPDIYFV